MATGGIEIDLAQVERLADDFSKAPNTIYRAIKGGFKDAAMRTMVPEIRRRARPRKYASRITARARGVGTVVLTSEGRTIPDGAVLGFMNFGGHPPRPITARRRKALSFAGTGDFAGQRIFVRKGSWVVNSGAKVPGKHFFEHGIDAGMSEFTDQVGDRIADRLESEFS